MVWLTTNTIKNSVVSLISPRLTFGKKPWKRALELLVRKLPGGKQRLASGGSWESYKAFYCYRQFDAPRSGSHHVYDTHPTNQRCATCPILDCIAGTRGVRDWGAQPNFSSGRNRQGWRQASRHGRRRSGLLAMVWRIWFMASQTKI